MVSASGTYTGSTLHSVVELLRSYRKILVTGPQRSGTNAAAHMLATDLGYKCHKETAYGIYERNQCFAVIRNNSDFCLQGPHAFHWLDGLRKEFPADVLAVVFMMRASAEIVASQQRIGWTFEQREADAVGGSPSHRVKQHKWIDKYMGKPGFFTLHYLDLSVHPMWVDKENRKGWSPSQTEP